MCQIVSDYMQTSNFSCFCTLVTAIQVFTTPTHGQPSAPWNCGRFARSSCFLWLHERFWWIHSSSRIQLSWHHHCNRKRITEIGLPVGWLRDWMDWLHFGLNSVPVLPFKEDYKCWIAQWAGNWHNSRYTHYIHYLSLFSRKPHLSQRMWLGCGLRDYTQPLALSPNMLFRP